MKVRHTAFLFVALLFVVACETVPITGRTQLDLVSDSSLRDVAQQQYRDFLRSHPLSDDSANTAMVKRVGLDVSRAVERHLRGAGMEDRLRTYQWEFNLVRDKQVNAWCMPGGKVVVYSGLLEVASDAGAMAVVIGHEVAHAVANHANERMSQLLLAQMGGVALAVALSERPSETQVLALAAYGLGTEIGLLLPYSRLHETEADRLGLIFMAMAGYDPHRAIRLWKDMAQLHHSSDALGFLSTHPTDKARIRNIIRMVPEAMKYYHPDQR